MKMSLLFRGLIGLLLYVNCLAQTQPETISLSSATYMLHGTRGLSSPITVVRTGGTGAALETVIQMTRSSVLFGQITVSFAEGSLTTEVMVPYTETANGGALTLTLLAPNSSVAVSPHMTAQLEWLSLDISGRSDVYVGVIGGARSSNGTVTVAVNASGSFTAQIKTLLGSDTARGAFGATQREYVVFNKVGMEIELQRHDQFDNKLEGKAVRSLAGPVSVTFGRVQRRSELASLPAQRVFTGAFRSSKGAARFAAPTHFRLSSGGRWTIHGRDRDGRRFAAASRALRGDQVCFGYIRAKPRSARSRTGMLTYDPATQRLNGSLEMHDVHDFDGAYTEDGPIGAYVRPVRGSLPGVFAGALPTPARFVVTDESGAQAAQAFSWLSPLRVLLEGGVNVRFNQTFNARSGFSRGRFKAAGISKVAGFAAAFVDGTGTADDGTFLGTAKVDGSIRLIQIVGP